jgi:hypothetical protein
MVHPRKSLALGLEPGNDLASVHPELDYFQRDTAAKRFNLLRQVHDAVAALAELFDQLVRAYYITE